MAENNQNTNEELLIRHVFGNVMRVAIPLTQRIRTLVDGHETETETEFYPNISMPMSIVLFRDGNYRVSYTPTVDGNVVTLTDNGTLPAGMYNVEVLCYDQSEQPCRYMVKSKIQVVSATKDAGIEAGIEFDSTDYVLDGAVYFYAKGDKGDPFTYEDFTPEQIADLKRPAVEAAGVAELAAQDARDAAQDARDAEQDARDAAQLAASKAEEARLAAINAKADYISQDNYVYHYDPETQLYYKTDIYVKGDRGYSVTNVEQIITSTESGGVNVIRVSVNDGNHYDFEVRNGEKVEARVDGSTLIM